MLQIKHFKRCQLDQDDFEDSENTKIGDKLLGDRLGARDESIAPDHNSMASPDNSSMPSPGKSSGASNDTGSASSPDCSENMSKKTFDKDPV